MKTYWVIYEYSYNWIDEEGIVEHETEGNGKRFHCLKKDIKKEVTKHIKDIELRYEKYSNLNVKIADIYETTEDEI